MSQCCCEAPSELTRLLAWKQGARVHGACFLEVVLSSAGSFIDIVYITSVLLLWVPNSETSYIAETRERDKDQARIDVE